MTTLTVSSRIDSKVAERAMLKHPFYQAWTEGRLPLDTLRAYARQYFHHVEAFPRAVSAVHSACPDRDGRRMLVDAILGYAIARAVILRRTPQAILSGTLARED